MYGKIGESRSIGQLSAIDDRNSSLQSSFTELMSYATDAGNSLH